MHNLLHDDYLVMIGEIELDNYNICQGSVTTKYRSINIHN